MNCIVNKEKFFECIKKYHGVIFLSHHGLSLCCMLQCMYYFQ